MPILRDSVTPANQKRGGPLSNAADDAYTFTISFDDKGKLTMDPGVDTSIFKNPGIFNTPISTTPIEGQHLKRGDPNLSAADDAYTFTISFDDKGKLILDPAIDKNVFKNPITTTPINTTPKGLHNKRQKPNLSADDAYTFHISFDDAGKMVLDPEFNKNILKNSGILNKPITLKPLQGQH